MPRDIILELLKLTIMIVSLLLTTYVIPWVKSKTQNETMHSLIDLATQAQKPNLIKQKQPMEVEYGSALDDIYNQYFIDMLYGNISIEDGTAQLIADWHSQGGDEVLAELNSVYAGK